MPRLMVNMMEGRTVEQKREMVKRLTEVMVETTGAKLEDVSVQIIEMSKENFGKAGVLKCDH